jgi:sterol desaturase/sphingolipid hydroxylase (fatty acid hydroxylase superfamily)
MSWASIEASAYWAVFSAALLGVALWEMYCPWRSVSTQLGRRWRNHALLVTTSTVITALIFRASLVAVAAGAANNRFGLLNRSWIPLAARWILALVLLDLLSYGLHYASHSVRLLWKVHQVHHSDPDYDLSTGVRNHPLETLLVQAVTAGTIVILAAPPAAILAAQLVGMLFGFFTHANAKLPPWIEKGLRMIFVTPEMHRVHHSDELRDQNANLGEIFPWWDHLFGTYVETPLAGLERMRVGLKGLQSPASAGFLFLLTLPFRRDATEQVTMPEPLSARVAGD